MIRRPPRSTRTDTSFPTRRSSDLGADDFGGLSPMRGTHHRGDRGDDPAAVAPDGSEIVRVVRQRRRALPPLNGEPPMATQRQRGAIVTGAGSPQGIGFAAARLIGAGGSGVVITSTTDRIFDRVKELRSAGIQAEGVVADLTDQTGVDAVVAWASGSLGGVDILANNAGMTSVSGSYPSGAIGAPSLRGWQASLERRSEKRRVGKNCRTPWRYRRRTSP